MNLPLLQEMTENGFAIKRIAKLLNYNEIELKTIVAENKFCLKKEAFDDSKIEHIVNLYNKGVSAKQLGIKYSIDKRRIQKWAEQKGILRTKNDSHRFNFFNQCVFDEINTNEKAYWLGFAYADAYVNMDLYSFSFGLARKDRDQVEKLVKFLELDIKNIWDEEIVDKETVGKIHLTSGVRVYSKHLCIILNRLGCKQAKSLILEFPQWLDKSLYRAFIRGFFDGDGSLKLYHDGNYLQYGFNICSTKDVIINISNYIKEIFNIAVSICHHSPDINKNTYSLYISGNQQILKVMRWLYENSDNNTRLTRKYNRYLELENKYGNSKN